MSVSIDLLILDLFSHDINLSRLEYFRKLISASRKFALIKDFKL